MSEKMPRGERLRRFLQPRHAACDCARVSWQGTGEADTPGADARCRLQLALSADERIEKAVFSAFGPPVVVACADWACEWLQHRTIAAARGLLVQDFEQALALASDERYAALLVIDALASALANLRS